MADGFPIGPRVTGSVRLVALLVGLAMLGLATHSVVLSLPWVGMNFPGFMVLDNRVVASVGLPHWTGMNVTGLRQSQVVAVDGRPTETAQELYDLVAVTAEGQEVQYLVRRDGAERTVTVPVQQFTLRDWIVFNGSFLWNGMVYLVAGLIVWALRPGAQVARAFLALGLAFALLLFPAVELYRPSTYFRIHIIGETFLWPAAFHLALTLPYVHRWARHVWVLYALAAVVLVAYQAWLYVPSVYSRIVLLNYSAIGLSAVTISGRLIWEATQPHSGLVLQRVRMLLVGTLIGFAIPGAAIAIPAMLGGDVSMNLPSAVNFVFALTIAYAIVKHDVFEIDAMVKRGAYYALLTGAVGVAYAAAVLLFTLVLPARDVAGSGVFTVAFTLLVLLFLNPIRTWLQAAVDRFFYRRRYDGAQLLAETGAKLSSALRRDEIRRLVRQAVDDAIPNSGTQLWVASGEGDDVRELDGDRPFPPVLLPHLDAGRLPTSFDSPEAYEDEATHDAVRTALLDIGAEVAIPLRHGDERVGVLTVGPKRSGLFYTAGDAEFMRALCHQAATALVNARTYEELVELNATLEQRVQDRTAQLEQSNSDLGAALTDLKAAEVQLVQSEKMASLGRLVAGIAHEINNPVSFISTSVAPLRRRLERAADEASASGKRAIEEAGELVEMMARGAERTATIVKDLRTFSRLHEATRKAADINDGLDVSIRLLESLWRDRITIHRSFGELPLVECDPGQMNQVFVNLLANACDAIEGAGNVWLETVHDGPTIRVQVRDDGSGVSPEQLGHVFDPFFTTKDVGQGTGLGLSISLSIVESHGGRIEVDSTVGEGTTFRVILPADGTSASLDTAAGRL